MLDIYDVTDGAHPVEYYADKFPGFPRFVHEIMHHVDSGKTPEEAATLSCDGLQKRLQDVIQEVEQTHAYMNEKGEINLPPLVLEYIEKHGIEYKPPESDIEKIEETEEEQQPHTLEKADSF